MKSASEIREMTDKNLYEITNLEKDKFYKTMETEIESSAKYGDFMARVSIWRFRHFEKYKNEIVKVLKNKGYRCKIKKESISIYWN